MSTTHPDLDALRRSDRRPPPRRRRVGARVVAVLLVLGLIAAIFAVAEPFLFPPRTVRVATVRISDRDAPVARAGAAIEDVGWLEAYPFPVTVRPLVSGVLTELPVLEGQTVVADETVIGVLRNLDIENAYDEAEALVRVREADVGRASAALEVARAVLEQRLDARAQQADVEGRLGVARQEVERLRSRHAEAVAAHATAKVDVRAQERVEAAGGATPVALERARARAEEARHRAADAEAAIRRAAADVVRLEALLTVATEGVEDPRVLAGEVQVAEQALAQARALRAQAQTDLTVAKRNLDHLTVRAPMSGVVMRLDAAPGAVVGPQGDFKEGEESGPGSTSRLNRMTGGLVTIYSPKRLQLRVDVLYGQLTHVREGAAVTFTADGIPGRTFHGSVHRLVHEADINQNALQAKIRVAEVHEQMRPEMLCRVRFEAPPVDTEAPTGDAPSVRRLLVPTEAVRDGAVWVYDPTDGGRARRIPVAVAGTQGELTAVDGALGLSTKVILDPVDDGEKVKVSK